MTFAEQLWAAFLEERPGVAGPGDTYAAWHFCDNRADADELVELEPEGGLRVTPLGRLVLRNVAMVFDAYLAEQRSASMPLFSQTV